MSELSEWDDVADHDAMVRKMGLLWLDKALELLARPVTILVLEEMEVDQERIVTRKRGQGEHRTARGETNDR